jgi:hypothetical protein
LATTQDTTQYTTPTLITERMHNNYFAMHHVTGLVQSDQTGRFPTVSSKGNHAEPLKPRSGPDIIAAYQAINALHLSRGMHPKFQRLDNEASTALLQFLTNQHIDAQLAPPHVHRRNAAERAPLSPTL